MVSIDNSKSSIVFWTAVGMVVYAVILLLHFRFNEAYVWLGTEDEFGENMTSVFYLVAGILVIAPSIKALKRNQTRLIKETMPLLLGLFFIFVAGEEISWGQRLLGFGTPESIRAQNVQGETTLHNLTFFHLDSALFNQHTALNAFALLMGVLIPLGAYTVKPVRNLLTRLNFPTLQLSAVVWFVLGLVHGQVISKMNPHWSNPEVKELIFSLGFFLFGLGYFRNKVKSNQLLEG